MNFFPRLVKSRIIGMTCAAIALPMVSLAAQAGSPANDVTFDHPTVVGTKHHVDVVSMAVPYGDLNLASPQGIAELDARVKRAVESVCGDIDVKNLAGNEAVRACRDAASKDAFAQVASLITHNQFASR
jgi:UrcA family protein